MPVQAPLAFMAAHSSALILVAHSDALICVAQAPWLAFTAAVDISGHQSQGGQSAPFDTIAPNAAAFMMGAAPGANTADLIILL